MQTRTKIIVGVLACMAAAAEQNALARTIVVHSTADDGSGSLRQALVLASNGDTINIVAQGTITLTSGELLINKSVAIRGQNAAKLRVSGNAASRVFHIAPNTKVTLHGLEIADGNVTGSFPANAGGGIFSDHADLTLDRCTITGNSARFGGGIFSNSSGGGRASLTVKSSTVRGNSASSGSGGGIFNGGGGGDAVLTMDTSVVSGNSAIFGGGIFNDGFSGSATATVNNSTVAKNFAILRNQGSFVAGGGGIYNNGDSGLAILKLTGSTLSGNSAGDVPIETTTEDGELAFIYNNGNGGGIYNDGGSSVRPGNAQITLVDTLVSGNEAHGIEVEDGPAGNGGGIYNNGSFGNATATLEKSTLELNHANADGGGIHNLSTSGSATTTLTGCTLKNNSAVDREEAIPVNNHGGAVFNLGDSGDAMLTLTGCQVTDNVAGLIIRDGQQTGAGGGLGSLGLSLYDSDRAGNAQLILTGTIVNRNIAGGGGAVDAGGFGTLAITRCDLSENLAGTGGAISFKAASATITDSTILGNRAQSAGGIFNGSNSGIVTMTITNSVISGNYGGGAGGGLLNSVNLQGFAILNVDKTTVSDNHAASGGGLFNSTDGATAIATITNSTLSGNAADVTPTLFATDPPGGGAVFNGGTGGTNATVNLANCTIGGNSTKYTGGAIQNVIRNNLAVDPGLARVSVNNCTLNGNSAVEGGNSIWNEAKVVEDHPPGNPAVDFANTILNDGAVRENIQNLLGTITSRGYNLTSDAAGGDGSTGPGGLLNGPGDIRNTNPQLGPLQDNGGPTLTHRLLKSSPAIDAGDPGFDSYAFDPPLLYDQRGPDFPRVVHGRVDVGAFELSR
jgi:hypothetical protein